MKSKMTFDELKRLVLESDDTEMDYRHPLDVIDSIDDYGEEYDDQDKDYDDYEDYDDDYEEEFEESPEYGNADFLPIDTRHALYDIIEKKGELYALYALLNKMHVDNPIATSRFVIDLQRSLEDDYARAERMRSAKDNH